ncbi:putative membrane protein [[Clostridium] cellulosi]|jgi:protein translocase, SecG subunit|uniref:Protein-export membrane protein SecG n=1 Tax=[Clostridium] cellulosi TaxID=29343 RepID=A0A078KRQ6_9FIRM|nr:MAG: preprotein translocase subunit SecG [[Clostridium] cellulosi]CDZ23830.1 putative membrane protein [[Clostridium] cellulosi]
MTAFQIVVSIILFIFSVVLVIIVLSQQGKDPYLGNAIAGGAAESFLGKNKARTIDSMLTKITRVIAVIFIALTVILNISQIFFS